MFDLDNKCILLNVLIRNYTNVLRPREQGKGISPFPAFPESHIFGSMKIRQRIYESMDKVI
jgi:hypothetical protein